MKKMPLALLLLCSLLVSLYGCASIDIERTDAQRFKDEYELVNGETKDGDDYSLRTVSIPENIPIVYKSFSEISQMMDDGKSFVVYFGFATCPWCRACVETFLDCAIESGLEEVYYSDVYGYRDIYEYNEAGEIECTQEAGEGYAELMARLDNVLDEYIVKFKGKEDYDVGEKRIYAPNFIAVVNGKAILLEESGDLMEDANAALSPEILAELTERYTALFNLVK